MRAIDNLEICCQIERSKKRRENSVTISIAISLPASVFNSKVMSGIMRAIVVNAIQAEWMVSLSPFEDDDASRWCKINSIICELCSNELCFFCVMLARRER